MKCRGEEGDKTDDEFTSVIAMIADAAVVDVRGGRRWWGGDEMAEVILMYELLLCTVDTADGLYCVLRSEKGSVAAFRCATHYYYLSADEWLH